MFETYYLSCVEKTFNRTNYSAVTTGAENGGTTSAATNPHDGVSGREGLGKRFDEMYAL
jgi:hypothetical protein